jgi:hypothetical protein
MYLIEHQPSRIILLDFLADLFNSHYYKFFDTRKTFPDAAAHAAILSIKGMPGHLVTFNHYGELDFILSVYPDKDGWVGLTDVQTEGKFVFQGGPESGQVATNIFPSNSPGWETLTWFGVNPDNWANNEDCVELWGGYGQFNDVDCYSTTTYFVEFDCPGVLIPSAQGGCTSTYLEAFVLIGCVFNCKSLYIRVTTI